jgi:hypothetical protein
MEKRRVWVFWLSGPHGRCFKHLGSLAGGDLQVTGIDRRQELQVIAAGCKGVKKVVDCDDNPAPSGRDTRCSQPPK